MFVCLQFKNALMGTKKKYRENLSVAVKCFQQAVSAQKK
jgi:hypothetical protein